MRYYTLTGRIIDERGLTPAERQVCDEIKELYNRQPSWQEFTATWLATARRDAWNGDTETDSPLYHIGQDLALRLGLREGRVAPPDYRDELATLITQRYPSRYAFCKDAAIDQGNLSRVLTHQRHFSHSNLEKILNHFGLRLAITQAAQTQTAEDDLLAQLRHARRRADALENLQAKADNCSPSLQAAVLPPAGLYDRLRARIHDQGEDFATALRQELQDAHAEVVRIAKALAAAAEKRSLDHKRLGKED